MGPSLQRDTTLPHPLSSSLFQSLQSAFIGFLPSQMSCEEKAGLSNEARDLRRHFVMNV